MKAQIKITQMRKLTLLLLLFTGMVNAQIVNIPDANFKARLLSASATNTIASTAIPVLNEVTGSWSVSSYTKIDTNNDGEIQITEAQAIKYLNLFTNSSLFYIYNISGIEFFTNLQYFDCMNNKLLSLDVSGMSNLKVLNCNDNLLTNLNVSGLINLQVLDCGSNNLSNLNVLGLTNLKTLGCESNILTVLNVTGLTNLKTLSFAINQIQSINVSGFINLKRLDCSQNLLTSLNVSGLTDLQSLDCSINQLNSLNISGLVNISFLSCFLNHLTSLDVSELRNLQNLQCFGNSLTTLFIKNGYIENSFNFSNNPNLTYICADQAQVASVQAQAAPNVLVTSYCSFTPGGDYNTISGNLKFDLDNNGCDANDLAQPNIRVNINDGSNTGASFTNTTGDYKFYTQAGSFVITPEIENPTFFNFTPATATIPFVDNNNNTATQDFCISANGVHYDLEIIIVPITPARPGFDATYQLVYKNKGNQTLSGDIIFLYNNSRLDFISFSQIPTNQNGVNIQWSYSNLLPFETRSIDVTFYVHSPTESSPVNIGDLLLFNIYILPNVNDENLSDNGFTLAQTVVGSFDPNDITCLEGNNVAPSEIGEYLHYIINFENTGNYPAENVVVKTIVDTTKFDVNSLQLLNTSNPVDARITGNVVEFIFENIQLGGPGGHGHILLKIKSKNTLVAGDAVAKNANIYFDYNAPVDTNLATTVFQSLSNTVFEKDDSINVSPNPTNGTININSNFNIKKLELYDVQGRVLETQIGETKTIDISEKANEIYFLKITTEKGSKVEKVIKE